MENIILENLSWLPNPEQKLLLLTALSEPEKARSAWLEWRETFSVEPLLDRSTQRLLPLAYQNLRRTGIEETLPPQFKQTHRQTFRDNQLLFREIEQIINAFAAAGIRSLLLKGAALSVRFYGSSALRPMSDADLLVEPADVFKASEILDQNGWQTSEQNLPLLAQIAHSCQFKNSAGQELDLHWHLMRDCWHADKNEIFWEAAVSFQFGNTRASALSATDQLFHVCCHGARFNANAPIRWIADAKMILDKSAAEIDWQRLIDLARVRRLQVALYLSLKYLEESFAAPIPPFVLDKLAATRVTKMEQIGFALLSEENKAPWAFKRYALELAFQYSSLRSRAKLKPRSRIFVRYLQYSLKLRSARQVPAELVRQTLRRFVFKNPTPATGTSGNARQL